MSSIFSFHESCLIRNESLNGAIFAFLSSNSTFEITLEFIENNFLFKLLVTVEDILFVRES